MSASALAITHPSNKQTGPRTQAGKERSSTNATLHGGTSRKLIVAGETQTGFDTLLNGLIDEYRPDTPQSRMFIENLALSHWFLWRRQRAYSAIETAVYQDQPDETQWAEEQLKRLSLADRYRTQAERALKRALINVDCWRRNTRVEANRQQRNTQWEIAQAIRERRITLQERKFNASQTRQADRAFRFAKTAPSSPAGVETVDLAQNSLSNRDVSSLSNCPTTT
jgi:hypothetical protein